MADAVTVEFFYDIASPYSYLSAMRIDDFAAEHGAEVDWRPFLLGGVFKATGNEMPASVDAKADWMPKDLAMFAEKDDIPFVFPDEFPIRTIAHLRALIEVKREDGADRARELAKAFYTAYWGEGRDISDPEVFAGVALEAGFEPERIVAANDKPENKQKLIELTNEAVERGAFGAPTFFVGDTMFWGNDRLDLLGEYLDKHVNA
jgi:2-hydroxychromene-2-carboxylate isomerase